MFLFCLTAGFVYMVCSTKPALSRFSNALYCTFIISLIVYVDRLFSREKLLMLKANYSVRQ